MHPNQQSDGPVVPRGAVCTPGQPGNNLPMKTINTILHAPRDRRAGKAKRKDSGYADLRLQMPRLRARIRGVSVDQGRSGQDLSALRQGRCRSPHLSGRRADFQGIGILHYRSESYKKAADKDKPTSSKPKSDSKSETKSDTKTSKNSNKSGD